MRTTALSSFLSAVVFSIVFTSASSVQPIESTFDLTKEALDSTRTALRAMEAKAEEVSMALQSERSSSHTATLTSDVKIVAQARELAKRASQVAAAEAEVSILTENSRRYAELARNAQTALADKDRELNATKTNLAAETEEAQAEAHENSIRLQSVQTRARLEDADERQRLGEQLRSAQEELQAFNATRVESSEQFAHNVRELEQTKSQLVIAQRRASMADSANRSFVEATMSLVKVRKQLAAMNAEMNRTKANLAQAVEKAQLLKAVQGKLAESNRQVVVFQSAMVAKTKELNVTRFQLASLSDANNALAGKRANLAANLGQKHRALNRLLSIVATQGHELAAMRTELAAARLAAETFRNARGKYHVAKKEVIAYRAALQLQHRKLATVQAEEVEVQRLRAASSQVTMSEFWELESAKSDLREETSALADANITLRLKDAELRLTRSELRSNASALESARGQFEKRLAAEDQALRAATEEEARLRAANDTTRKLSMLKVATTAEVNLRTQLAASRAELAEVKSQAHVSAEEVTDLKGRAAKVLQMVADKFQAKDDAVAAELTKRDQQQWATELKLNATQQQLDTVRGQLAELAPAAREQMEDDEAKGRELTKAHAQLISKDAEIQREAAGLQAARGRIWAEEAELNRTRAAARNLADSGLASGFAQHGKEMESRKALLLAKVQIEKARADAAESAKKAAAAEARDSADVAALKDEHSKRVRLVKKIRAERAEAGQKMAADDRKASELQARDQALQSEVAALQRHRGPRGRVHLHQGQRRHRRGAGEVEKADF